MRFLIPTYGRGRQLALEYLTKAGADVTIQTQTESDRDTIRARYAGVRVNCDTSASCLSQNANNGLRLFEEGETVAVLDDDVRYAIICEGGRRRKAGPEEFMRRVDALSRAMDERKADVGIGFPSNGISFRDAGGMIEENKIGSGWLMLVRVGSVWYDESLTSCEDYDMQLRVISGGGRVLRDNGMAHQSISRTIANGRQEGGRGFYYEDDEHRRNVRTVVERYYPIAKFARGKRAIALNGAYL